MSNFMKILPLGAEFNADGRRDRQTHGHDEANSRFLQFCERARVCASLSSSHLCS